MTVVAFTQVLYDQALEEQRKGTKGLTKFLAKWRKQLEGQFHGTPNHPGQLEFGGKSRRPEALHS